MRREKTPRTGFVFDGTPWKVRICDKTIADCLWNNKAIEVGPLLAIDSLPAPPEPGRIPESADHVHIAKAYSGSQGRNPREEDKWKSLMKSVCRCEHGKIMRDPCPHCAGGTAPDETGALVGFTYRGQEVRIPEYDDLDKIDAWIRD